MRTRVRSLAWLSGLGMWHYCELQISCRLGWDPVLLWLWCRPAAVALILPLAWEAPDATGMALKKKKKALSPIIYKNKFKMV